jgi:hypothetical protein
VGLLAEVRSIWLFVFAAFSKSESLAGGGACPRQPPLEFQCTPDVALRVDSRINEFSGAALIRASGEVLYIYQYVPDSESISRSNLDAKDRAIYCFAREIC